MLRSVVLGEATFQVIIFFSFYEKRVLGGFCGGMFEVGVVSVNIQ